MANEEKLTKILNASSNTKTNSATHTNKFTNYLGTDSNRNSFLGNNFSLSPQLLPQPLTQQSILFSPFAHPPLIQQHHPIHHSPSYFFPPRFLFNTQVNSSTVSTNNQATCESLDINPFQKCSNSDISMTASCNCNPNTTIVESNMIFYFRVKFYVTDLLLLNDPLTRYCYYLQLRQNYLSINHKLSDERYFMMASLILVADYGPFNYDIHVGPYFNLNACLPQWILNKLGRQFVCENLPRLHQQQSMRHHTPVSAQYRFCSELSSEENSFNLHLYNVYKNKEETPGTISLGIAPKGILVFELRSQLEINLISTFEWPMITKLISDVRNFNSLCKSLTIRKTSPDDQF